MQFGVSTNLRREWHSFCLLNGRMTSRYYSSTTPCWDKHADEMRNYLHSAGALEMKHGPITIEAERSFGTVTDNNDKHSKIVHFQRHGQGYHNLLYVVLKDAGNPIQDIYHPDPQVNPFLRPEIVDAPLTEHGRAQCARQQQHAASNLRPELLIVSPLHRAIQTAQITFADFRDKIPFVAHESCREELGLLRCNQRRPLSETIREFPDVDFSLITSGEQDTLFDPSARECPKKKSLRIYSFLVDFLRHRPEKEIAVVGHSAWLFNMCHTVLDCGDDDELRSWFGTAEIRSMNLRFSSLD
jgi:broad specificity phosphatase PhoE